MLRTTKNCIQSMLVYKSLKSKVLLNQYHAEKVEDVNSYANSDLIDLFFKTIKPSIYINFRNFLVKNVTNCKKYSNPFGIIL